MASEPAPYPIDELHAAAPDAATHIDALNAELQKDAPDAAAIDQHVGTLRKHESLGSIIEGWLSDARTSSFISELTATGL